MSAENASFVKVDEHKQGIAIIKLNRPQSGNSLHPRLVTELLAAIRWANETSWVNFVVVTGEGRFFCTGMDLRVDEQLSFTSGSAFFQLNEALIRSDKILIAAVNGPAVGYGVSVLGLFDLVYSAPGAYFFMPFVKWGMAAEGGSSFTFPRIMGYQRAAQLCLTGRRFTATEAHQMGLVGKIIEGDNFLKQVLADVEATAESPIGALMATKKLMKQPMLQDLLDANNRECWILQNERLPSGDKEKAVKQFEVEQQLKRQQKQPAKSRL